MSTFALVHGLWHDAHAWFDCARQLRGSGHNVHLIPLAGHGKRPKRQVLHHHCVDSICAYFQTGRLSDVVLVGHSCSATWAMDAAARMPRGAVSQVLLSSPLMPPGPGESVFAALPTDLQDFFGEIAHPQNDRPCVPPAVLCRRYLTNGLSDEFYHWFQRHYARGQPCLPLAADVDLSAFALSDIPIGVVDMLDDPLRNALSATDPTESVARALGIATVPIKVVTAVGGSLSFLGRPKEFARLLIVAAEQVERLRRPRPELTCSEPDWGSNSAAVSRMTLGRVPTRFADLE